MPGRVVPKVRITGNSGRPHPVDAVRACPESVVTPRRKVRPGVGLQSSAIRSKALRLQPEAAAMGSSKALLLVVVRLPMPAPRVAVPRAVTFLFLMLSMVFLLFSAKLVKF